MERKKKKKSRMASLFKFIIGESIILQILGI